MLGGRNVSVLAAAAFEQRRSCSVHQRVQFAAELTVTQASAKCFGPTRTSQTRSYNIAVGGSGVATLRLSQNYNFGIEFSFAIWIFRFPRRDEAL